MTTARKKIYNSPGGEFMYMNGSRRIRRDNGPAVVDNGKQNWLTVNEC